MGLLIFTNEKGNSYNLFLVIIDWLINMIYYQLVKIIINVFDLIEVILDMVI